MNPREELKKISPLVSDYLSKVPENKGVPADYFANFADQMLEKTKTLAPEPLPTTRLVWGGKAYALAACCLVLLGLGIWAVRNYSASAPADNALDFETIFASIEKEDIRNYLIESSDDLRTDWLAVLDFDYSLDDIYTLNSNDLEDLDDTEADYLLESLDDEDLF